MNDRDLAPTPNNVFSFSRVKCFHQCPLRYRFRYHQGLKEAFRSIESFLGNVVHEVLEWLYVERDRGPHLNEEAMLDRFAVSWQEGRDESVAIIRVDDSEESYLKLGREMLVRFFHETFAADRSETVALEQRVSLRLSDTVVFTGFADRIGRTEQGRLFVVDYKTSKSQGDESEFSEGLQAPMYAACVLDDFGESEALAGYHYLRHGSTRWHHVDSDRAARLFGRFRDLANEADACTEFPARPGVLCAWCGFNAQCPAAEVSEHFSGGLRAAERHGRRLF